MLLRIKYIFIKHLKIEMPNYQIRNHTQIYIFNTAFKIVHSLFCGFLFSPWYGMYKFCSKHVVIHSYPLTSMNNWIHLILDLIDTNDSEFDAFLNLQYNNKGTENNTSLVHDLYGDGYHNMNSDMGHINTSFWQYKLFLSSAIFRNRPPLPLNKHAL